MNADDPRYSVADAGTRERALDVTRSWILRGPPGAGKSALLMQRVLALLAAVDEPEHVLVITRTREAATQLRGEILWHLRDADAPPRADPHRQRLQSLADAVRQRDRIRAWGLATSPSRLRVEPLAELCLRIAHARPLRAQLPPGVGLAPQPEAAYREAAEAVLASWGEGPAATAEGGAEDPPEAVLLECLDGDRASAVTMMITMLATRHLWLRQLTGADGMPCATAAERGCALDDGLQGIVEDAVAAVSARQPPELAAALPALAAGVAEHLAAAGSRSPVLACRGMQAMPGDDASALDRWLGLRELLLSPSGSPRRTLMEMEAFTAPAVAGEPVEAAAWHRQMPALLASLEGHPAFVRALHALGSLPPVAYPPAQRRLMQALAAVLPRTAGRLRSVLAERGEVDLVEAVEAALRALRTRARGATTDSTGDFIRDTADADDAVKASSLPDTGASADGHAAAAPPEKDRLLPRHLLVDDVDDVCSEHPAVLAELIGDWQPDDGRTLFLTGSAGQPGDREGGLLDAVERHGLARLTPGTLVLHCDSRTAPRLLAAVNTCLSPLRGDTGAPPAVSPPRRLDSDSEDVAGLHKHFGSDMVGQTEAEHVAGVVAAALARPRLTVAILVRSITQLSAILPALRAAGLRYRGFDIEPLHDEPVVRDLHALTRALCHLDDRAAWLASLRAPWCGLSLYDLHALVHEDRGRTVWDAIVDQRVRRRLSPDGRRRLSRFKGVIADAWANRSRGGLRSWIEGTWSALGGSAVLRGEFDQRNAARYLALLDSLEQGVNTPVPARLDDALTGLFAAPDPAADGRLQIMSIQRARGRAFDVVVLPGLGTPVESSQAPLLEVASVAARNGPAGRGHLVVAAADAHADADADAVAGFLRRRAQREEELALARLTVQAMTRARTALYLSGQLEQHRDGRVHPPARSMLAMLEAGTTSPTPGAASAAAAPAERLHASPAPVGTVASDGTGAAPEARRRPSEPDIAAIRRLPAAWALPPLPVPDLAQATRPSRVQRSPLLPLDGADNGDSEAGRVMHWLLTRIAGNPAALADAGAGPQLSRQVVGALHRAGLRDEALLNAARTTVRAVQATLAEQWGRWVLSGAHAEVRSALSLSSWLDGRLVSAWADLSFVSEGERWLITLATGVQPGSQVEEVVAIEVAAAREELARTCRLVRMVDERPLRTAIYFPFLQRWVELEAMDPAAMGR